MKINVSYGGQTVSLGAGETKTLSCGIRKARGNIQVSATSESDLEYALSADGTYYTCTGIGTVRDGDIEIPSTFNGLPVRGIGESAFANCGSLKKLIIRAAATSVDLYAFRFCENLQTVDIDQGITKIQDRMFQSCTSLKTIVIPSGVKSIESAAFENCSSLTSIILPDSVTDIYGMAFEDCSELANVIIPASVTRIVARAFNRCDSLTDVYYKGTAAQWNAITIGEKNEDLTNATIHYNYQG